MAGGAAVAALALLCPVWSQHVSANGDCRAEVVVSDWVTQTYVRCTGPSRTRYPVVVPCTRVVANQVVPCCTILSWVMPIGGLHPMWLVSLGGFQTRWFWLDQVDMQVCHGEGSPPERRGSCSAQSQHSTPGCLGQL